MPESRALQRVRPRPRTTSPIRSRATPSCRTSTSRRTTRNTPSQPRSTWYDPSHEHGQQLAQHLPAGRPPGQPVQRAEPGARVCTTPTGDVGGRDSRLSRRRRSATWSASRARTTAGTGMWRGLYIRNETDQHALRVLPLRPPAAGARRHQARTATTASARTRPQQPGNLRLDRAADLEQRRCRRTRSSTPRPRATSTSSTAVSWRWRVGYEFRREELNNPGTPGTDTGNVVGLGYSAAFGSRNINALYAELYAPILKNLEPRSRCATTTTRTSAARGTRRSASSGRSFRSSSRAAPTPRPSARRACTRTAHSATAGFTSVNDPVRCPVTDNRRGLPGSGGRHHHRQSRTSSRKRRPRGRSASSGSRSRLVQRLGRLLEHRDQGPDHDRQRRRRVIEQSVGTSRRRPSFATRTTCRASRTPARCYAVSAPFQNAEHGQDGRHRPRRPRGSLTLKDYGTADDRVPVDAHLQLQPDARRHRRTSTPARSGTDVAVGLGGHAGGSREPDHRLGPRSVERDGHGPLRQRLRRNHIEGPTSSPIACTGSRTTGTTARWRRSRRSTCRRRTRASRTGRSSARSSTCSTGGAVRAGRPRYGIVNFNYNYAFLGRHRHAVQPGRALHVPVMRMHVVGGPPTDGARLQMTSPPAHATSRRRGFHFLGVPNMRFQRTPIAVALGVGGFALLAAGPGVAQDIRSTSPAPTSSASTPKPPRRSRRSRARTSRPRASRRFRRSCARSPRTTTARSPTRSATASRRPAAPACRCAGSARTTRWCCSTAGGSRTTVSPTTATRRSST